MYPVEFPEHNTVYAKDQPEYRPLPALKLNSPNGEIISCWQLSFKERIRVLFTGKVWMSLLSFHGPLTPSMLATDKTELFKVVENHEAIQNNVFKPKPKG